MSDTNYVSVSVRIPVDLHALIAKAAKDNTRKRQDEMIHRLRKSFEMK